MKTRYLLLFILFVSVLDIQAQNDSISFRKIDLNLNFVTKTSKNKQKSFQALITFYPVHYKFLQFGISSAYESLESNLPDSFVIQERRIPLLFTTRLNLSRHQIVYLKGQVGTALTLSSNRVYDVKEVQNFRTDLKAPLLAQISFGVNVPLANIGVGFELGFTYKQFSYKEINSYPSAISLGLVLSVP